MKSTLLPLMIFTTLMTTSLVNAEVVTASVNPIGVTAVESLDASTAYYIGLEGLRVRSTAVDTGRSLGILNLNDKVKVINPSIIHNQRFVEINVVKTYYDILNSEHYFIEKSYLSSKPVNYKEFKGKYFAVVNVASETLRLYERSCAGIACANKMILETEIVVGEDKDHPASEPGKGRSVLGSYRITGWSKFYEDGKGHYPAWYREEYPNVPEVGDSGAGWLSGKVMPKDEKGKKHGVMRGAFGWYTAFVGPEAHSQWTHGTIGWGADKDAMIKRTKKPLLNLVSDPRSSGCTRNNNEAIAILRTYLQIGDPIVKIYAREDIADKSLSNYPTQFEPWEYILTKEKSHLVKREDVLKMKNFSNDMIIEEGTYERDVHPDAMIYTPGEKLGKLARQTKRTGNVYGVKSTNMNGTFYVDTGTLEGYSQPTEILEVSGFMDEVTPSFMK